MNPASRPQIGEHEIETMGTDPAMREATDAWLLESTKHRYSYHFSWMGRPIIQYPQDMIAMQEIIWEVKPDVIVETGIAHGGSLIFYASMLHLLGGEGRVIGIDIDIREPNRVEIEAHPMASRIEMHQASSLDETLVTRIAEACRGKRVLVVLDSNHTHDHVLRECELYGPLVSKGSYMVVFDTIVEEMPKACYPDRPWGPGDNPKTAVDAFLKATDRFEIDRAIDQKLLITVARSGYLRCVRD